MKELGIRNVSVFFGRLRALADVSLNIREREVVMLAGPNGSGKSTLIRVLLGLVRADSGTLSIEGRERVVDNDFKARIGYLPEAVAFPENLSGRQVLRFFAAARGVKKARIDEVLERVGLTAAAQRQVKNYSRGMRQRLGLGIAILHTPELLILDEPTGGLDQQGLHVLWSVLSEWREACRMVLVATHELTLMEHRVDRMCLLRSGAVRADDTPLRLRQSAALPARVSLTMGTGANLTLFISELERFGVGQRMKLEDDVLTMDVDPQNLLPLLSSCRQASDLVQNLRVVEPGLDLVYEQMLKVDG